MIAKPTRIVSYIRVSIARQGESGLGLEAQRASVEAFAREHGGTPWSFRAPAEFVRNRSCGHKRSRSSILDAAPRGDQARRPQIKIWLAEKPTEQPVGIAAFLRSGRSRTHGQCVHLQQRSDGRQRLRSQTPRA
jgi:hypothetical protein